MPYLLLAGAIVLEVVATINLRLSEGFTRLVPAVLVVIGYVGAFGLLAQRREQHDLGPPAGSTNGRSLSRPAPPAADGCAAHWPSPQRPKRAPAPGPRRRPDRRAGWAAAGVRSPVSAAVALGQHVAYPGQLELTVGGLAGEHIRLVSRDLDPELLASLGQDPRM